MTGSLTLMIGWIDMSLTNTTWKVVHTSIMNDIVAHYFPFATNDEAHAFYATVRIQFMDSLLIVEM